MKPWRFIDTGCRSACFNKAADEMLLSSETPVLRIYCWKPPALSLGRFQDSGDINRQLCAKLGIDIFRRASGGKAAFHEHEISYSFICSEQALSQNIIESYRLVGGAVLAALKSMGLKAVMKESAGQPSGTPICFLDTSWYEIEVHGKKIVGHAQWRTNKKVLQHGSILLELDAEKYASLFAAANRKLAEKIRGRMTCMHAELERKITYAELAAALKHGFEQGFKTIFMETPLSEKEMSDINAAEMRCREDNTSA